MSLSAKSAPPPLPTTSTTMVTAETKHNSHVEPLQQQQQDIRRQHEPPPPQHLTDYSPAPPSYPGWNPQQQQQPPPPHHAVHHYYYHHPLHHPPLSPYSAYHHPSYGAPPYVTNSPQQPPPPGLSSSSSWGATPGGSDKNGDEGSMHPHPHGHAHSSQHQPPLPLLHYGMPPHYPYGGSNNLPPPRYATNSSISPPYPPPPLHTYQHPTSSKTSQSNSNNGRNHATKPKTSPSSPPRSKDWSSNNHKPPPPPPPDLHKKKRENGGTPNSPSFQSSSSTEQPEQQDRDPPGCAPPAPPLSSDTSTDLSRRRPLPSSSSTTTTTTSQFRKVGNAIVEERTGDVISYACSVPLGMDDDKFWLSDLQVYLRTHFVEVFGATEEDIAAPMHGRNKPILLGQVGIRCMYCKYESPELRSQQAVSFPLQLSGIYNSVQQMLRLHVGCCSSMPEKVQNHIDYLRKFSNARGGRKQYWIDSAIRLGLKDSAGEGIRFSRDPSGPMPPLTGPSLSMQRHSGRKGRNSSHNMSKDEDDEQPPPPKELGNEKTYSSQSLPHTEVGESSSTTAVREVNKPAPPLFLSAPPRRSLADAPPVVFPEDKPLIPEYLYLSLEQMATCTLLEADRIGCYLNRNLGSPGLACRHCLGKAGSGRYFPSSEGSLSQTTTSQTIVNHVRHCQSCPREIRDQLELLKQARAGHSNSHYHSGGSGEKPEHGGRKLFFQRLWKRIQGACSTDGKGKEQSRTFNSMNSEDKNYQKDRRGNGAKRKHDDTSDDESSSDGYDTHPRSRHKKNKHDFQEEEEDDDVDEADV
ncbi:hypothetical protein ACA910_011714 [Epithemia clementina (nom. ined.)]